MTRTHGLAHAVSHGDEHGSLELVYVPEVSLATGALLGLEARLHARGDAPTDPDWVLDEAVAERARWHSDGAQMWLGAESGVLREPDLVERVVGAVAAHGLGPDALGLRLDDATLRGLGADAPRLLEPLRAAGVALAVDDLPSWFATLGALDRLPLTAVTLGARHVRALTRGGPAAVARTVVEAAHGRGLLVVAEGVETAEQAARLLELGCDRAHGPLLCSPVRADKARWLMEHGTGWAGTPALVGLAPAPVSVAPAVPGRRRPVTPTT